MSLPIDRTFLELIPAAAYAVSPDGTIASCNPHAIELWGQIPVLGSHEWRWCGAFRIFETDGTPIDKEKCLIADVLAKGITVKDYPMLVERPDGSRIQVLANVGPIRDAAGTIVGAINTFRDVTEQKQAEERLRQSVAAAEAANKAKDRFLAMLSHELRTPLSPVVMTVAAMEADPDLPARVQEDVAMIRRNLELEVRLIDDLLDISRVSNGKLHLDPHPVRVHELLRHVVNSCLSDTQGKRLSVECDFAAANDHVVADPARLQQVFWNLLRNAAKFTPEGGVIRVRTRNAESTGQLCVEVSDSGIGIPAGQLETIFDAFDQGDGGAAGKAGGLGLGLAIAKAVVDLHGGTISAESGGPGRGATFTVRLNVEEEAARPATGTACPAAMAASTQDHLRLRILLVEDHADTAMVMERLLGMAGYEVHYAGKVSDALDAAARQQFDLVVSDIGLPDASGHDLMRQLRDRYELKGIALTGFGMEDDVQKARAAGFQAHLTKPVDLNRLLAIIGQIASPRKDAVPSDGSGGAGDEAGRPGYIDLTSASANQGSAAGSRYR